MNPQLDLGCSSHKKEGWIGLDIQELKNVDIIGDAHNMPIRKNVITDICSSKVFEHLTNPYDCLSDCKFIMVEGGVLTIGIPNIQGLSRFLRWGVRGKISVGDHLYCWGLPEIVNLVERFGYKYYHHYLDTYARYHSLNLLQRIIRLICNRIIDKNLNVVFIKELMGDMD